MNLKQELDIEVEVVADSHSYTSSVLLCVIFAIVQFGLLFIPTKN